MRNPVLSWTPHHDVSLCLFLLLARQLLKISDYPQQLIICLQYPPARMSDISVLMFEHKTSTAGMLVAVLYSNART